MNDPTADGIESSEQAVSNISRTKSGRRPPNYWKDFKHVREELKPVVRELGHFPSRDELIDYGLGGLVDAVKIYHGGFKKVKKRMGYSPSEVKLKGYWTNFDHVREGLERLVQKLGHFPSSTELGHENSGLCSAIYNHHGGYSHVAGLFGNQIKKRPNSYWQDFGHVRERLEMLVEKLGHFPSPDEINGSKLGSLSYAINHHHGGLTAVKVKMGYADQELEVIRQVMQEL